MGFRFRLARLLELRRQEEEAEKAQLAVAARQTREAAEALSAALARQEEAWRQWQAARGWTGQPAAASALSAELLLWQSRYQTRLAADVEGCRRDLARLQEVQEAARRRFEEARRKRELLERLMARRRAGYERVSARREQAEIDELAGRIIGRW